MIEDKFFVKKNVLDINKPPLLIAEAGVGHFGSLERAYKLIDLAVESNCKVVKFQHFLAKDLISETDSTWLERLSGRDTTIDFIKKIDQYAQRRKICSFFTPHTEQALDDLIELGLNNLLKIGSGERGNHQIIKKALDSGAFLLISTGTYLEEDLNNLKLILQEYPPNSSCVLHCNTIYPTPPEYVHLSTILHLKELFKGLAHIGYSDHTVGTAIPLASVVYGVRVIEKHISLERNIPNAQDWKVSCFKEDLSYLVEGIETIWQASNKLIKVKEIPEVEFKNRNWANKSCFLSRDIYKNQVLTDNDIKIQRPYNGLSPNIVFKKIIGKKYIGENTLKEGSCINESLINLFK